MTTVAQPTESGTQVPPKGTWVDSQWWDLFPVKLRLPITVVAAGNDACERWFVDFTLANEDTPWMMELNSKGELELTMPPYEPSDVQENRTAGEVYLWDKEQGYPGLPTGPTSGYRLPNGALRVPDAAWTALENVRTKEPGDQGGRPYCPDFVVEIRSTTQSRPSDLDELLNKMQEYMENGAQLGWLIDPVERTVRIYRAGADEPELLTDPEMLDGENVLTGFAFNVRRLIFDLQ